MATHVNNRFFTYGDDRNAQPAAEAPSPSSSGSPAALSRAWTQLSRWTWRGAIAVGIVVVLALGAMSVDGFRPQSGSTAEWANAMFAQTVVFEEIMTDGKLDRADDVVAPYAIIRTPDARRIGPAGLKVFVVALHRTIADPQVTVEELTTKGELATARWTMLGTAAAGTAAPDRAGEPVQISGSAVMRIVDGQIQAMRIEIEE